MLVEIPLISNADYNFNAVIDSIPLRFRQIWNSRDKSWRLDIQESSGTPIVQGLKLLPDQNLTGRYVDARLPEGDFFFISEDQIERPTFDNIGRAQKLYYYRED